MNETEPKCATNNLSVSQIVTRSHAEPQQA